METNGIKQTEHGTEVWSVYQQRWVYVGFASDEDLAALPVGPERDRCIEDRNRYRNVTALL